VQSDQPQNTTPARAKLDAAEEILKYSNRNIELTMEILVGSPQSLKHHLLELSENGAVISNLIEKILSQVDGDKERELLAAASSSWSRTHGYAESMQSVVDGKQFDAVTATSNIVLPLLLDNSCWKAFVHFLRAHAAGSSETKHELADRTRELVRAHQEMKSAAAERKRIAERLSQLASIIEYSSDAIVIFTLNGLIVSWNTAAETIYGYSGNEILGRPRKLLMPSDQADDLPEIAEKLKQGERIKRFETVHIGKGGRRIDVSMTISPVKDAHEQIIGAAAITRDVSDRKLLEKQLQQAQKMEAIGQLAGGIAHDFNNLLSVISGHCELLSEQLDQNERPQQHCEQIKKAGQRAAGLTRQLLAFSRQQVLEPTVLNLNAVVVDLEKMLKRVIGEDVEFRISLDSRLAPVKADRGQIEQVLMNLVVNARDAMPDGGRLIIETSNIVLDDEFVQQRGYAQRSYVGLSVTDNGIGMDADTQARIFEPFFTTKEVGKGTGLGLSTVYGVITQSGGHIEVQSRVGQGTTFRVYLPTVKEPVREQKPKTPAEKRMGSLETILLVEDEDALRALISDLLVNSGYNVLQTESPEKAMLLAQEYSGPIHLLLTDVIMPGMNGRALAQKLVVLRPELKVVYMSGYAGFKQSEILEAPCMLLAKPFEWDTLLSKLRDALASSLEPQLS
jgi:two-component system, cell cycle sensor histidine kinase and response regulator CckA